ncbi:transposase [Amycolatopsis mediterranei S699]|uniref:Transposase n=2 Tax=Amycolatopsis mediterranei TaxID=33910 RepID=A0A0H3DGM3_AMYMU|nr:transposase [Amycolatopsis mediterranei U32]AEK45734.1 transposase [Amycolatopsis mediterranei S699]AGT87631.1 transposase [Amycolatopsis mediterranei RB]KDO04011.1 transposase [Amycolatopsis mediterranei]AFO80503.1 transposase [Amycolatopsis mediterranei S699]
MTREDLAAWDQEFRDVCARLDGLFYRTDSRAHARHYVRGLIAPLERKNGWTIAEYSGNPEPKALQRLLNLSPWDADEARDLVRAYAMEHFADPRAVLIADPTGFAKKGDKSAGVQRQYSGTLGRIDNCQIGVFLAYANTAGDRVLIDRELYLPNESWCADPDRRAEAHVPGKVTFATRPKQVQDMIERAVAAGVPFAWFAADEEFGQNPGLRSYLEDEGIAYAMAVPKNTDTNTGGISSAATLPTLVKHVASRLKPHDWSRRACGIGAKGFRTYDWALVDAGDGHQYVFRRNIADGELAYFHCYNPHGESLTELVRVIGSRWPIEECFEAAKTDAGLDNYQVRLYHAWYRHITLSMLAMAFLAVMRHKAKKEKLHRWAERTP